MPLVWPELTAAIGAAREVAEIGGTTVRDLPRALYRLVAQGRLNLFLVGCGGTGKSSLREFLLTGSPEKVPATHLSTQTRERGRVGRVEAFADIYDYPGQAGPFIAEFNRDRARFEKARRNVVIMCCAYGYHSDWGESTGFANRPSTLQPTTVSASAALDDCRENELKFLERFLAERATYLPRLQMITVILKQNLWFDRHDEAERFYLTRYSPVIERFQAQNMGAARFRHYFNPLCIRRENFTEIIRVNNTTFGQETLGGKFTATVEFAYRALFFQQLHSLIQLTIG